MNIGASALLKLIAGESLGESFCHEIIKAIFSGEINSYQAAGILSLWQRNGLSKEEFSSVALASRSYTQMFNTDTMETADIVGTGGDLLNTINISTASSILAASLGIYVAKHGNSAVSSKCGSSNVLSKLGIKVDLDHLSSLKMFKDHKWCFLFAPLYNPSFAKVKEVRNALNIKTHFNYLGPLLNPSNPKIMLLGVSVKELLPLYAHALEKSLVRKALIVYGDGMDEINLSANNTCLLYEKDKPLQNIILTHEDFGIEKGDIEDIKGDDSAFNANKILKIFNNEDKKAALWVCANAAALLWLSGKAPSLKSAFEKCLTNIANKNALKLLHQLQIAL